MLVGTGDVEEYPAERMSGHGEWEMDDRRHSATGRADQVSSAGRASYSDRSPATKCLFCNL